MSVALAFNDVSKRFVLSRERAQSFQQWFMDGVWRKSQHKTHEFWALRQISFTVEHGESVALVGANGAGKSTALKLISRIISPTLGRVKVGGRVTALLELGAGFHPDLSGRDNIFLYGTIMGMPRRELRKRFDSIVDFAGIDEFVDEPVRNYSSGMQARLGFAVSVHLDPKILLVDEALSVGDQAFQQKCSTRLQLMRREGVTLFFVSHSLEAVTQNCTRALWLEHGQMMGDGPAGEIVDAYMQRLYSTRNARSAQTPETSLRLEGDQARLTKVEILDTKGEPTLILRTHQPCIVRMHYKSTRAMQDMAFGLAFYRADAQVHLAGPNTALDGTRLLLVEGCGYVDYCLDNVPWLPGEIEIHASIYDHDHTRCYHFWQNCAHIMVTPGGTRQHLGVMSLSGRWQA